jgi:glycosyltransferase involved in cell wall biosynthesis
METAIVIPCYDAARRVGEVVRGALASGLPVYVVDDGSRDDSAAAAHAAGATAVLRHPRNQGKGAAIRTGFRWALSKGATSVLTLDADGQHDPREIPVLLAAHSGNPDALIIGVRSFAPDDMPRRSRIGNRISTFWIGRFSGRAHRDTQSGFRVYPHALTSLPQLRTSRFDTETELLLLAARLRVPLVEVPVRTIYDADRTTHFHGMLDTLRVLGLVISSPVWARKIGRES